MKFQYKNIELEKAVSAAEVAGKRIMDIYSRDFGVEYKDDKSPLTDADRVSNEAIMQVLLAEYPSVPVISEENKQLAYGARKDWGLLWLVDPLDGTKEFIKKNGEFTVNIALVENGVPVAGIVYLPAKEVMYVGVSGQGAFRRSGNGSYEEIQGGSHYRLKDEVFVVGSRSHLSEETLAFVEQLKSDGKKVEFRSSGSSIKLCMVAEGSADVYPRFGPTMEWDTAAAHALVTAAGKKVLRWPDLQPLTYNKEDLLNPWFIVE
jgi:3'(2'), 5'-bisphosphate nucleotidase